MRIQQRPGWTSLRSPARAGRAWNRVAQVVQDGSWQEASLCLFAAFFSFFFFFYYRRSENAGVTLAACWQSGLSLEKAMHEMHRGRRRYSSLIIRPHQLAYGFVNLKLAKWQLRQTLRSEKETRWRAHRQKLGGVLEKKKLEQESNNQAKKKKKKI